MGTVTALDISAVITFRLIVTDSVNRRYITVVSFCYFHPAVRATSSHVWHLFGSYEGRLSELFSAVCLRVVHSDLSVHIGVHKMYDQFDNLGF